MHTGDEITNEPLQIVAEDPVQEREQLLDVADDTGLGGHPLVDEVHRRGLLFDVRVGAGDGEYGLAARDVLDALLIAVVELDAEHLGQAVADLSRGRAGHCGEAARVEGGKEEEGRRWRVLVDAENAARLFF